jgi:hypothetical protein
MCQLDRSPGNAQIRKKSGHFRKIGGTTRQHAPMPSRVAQYFATMKQSSDLFRAFAYGAVCHIK